MTEKNSVLGLDIQNVSPSKYEVVDYVIEDYEELTLYKIDNRLIISSNRTSLTEDVVSLFEDIAVEIGIETTSIEIVLIDMENSIVRPADGMNSEFRKNNDLSANGLIPISMVGEVVEFVNETELLESMERSSLNSDNSSSKAISADGDVVALEKDAKVVTSEEKSESEPVNTFVDNVASSFEVIEKPIFDMKEKAEIEIKEKPKEETVETVPELENLFSDMGANNDVFEDEYLEKARRIFEEKSKYKLPLYSEVVVYKMQADYFKSSNNINQAKEKALADIRERILREKGLSLKILHSEKLNAEEEELENSIDNILSNHKVDSVNLKGELSQEYKKAKSTYVDSQIKIAESFFDNENLTNYQNNVKIKLRALEDEVQLNIDQKRSGFRDYSKSLESKTEETVIKNLDVSDILSEYKNTFENERHKLKKKAEKIEVLQSEMEQELNRKVEELELKLQEKRTVLDIQQSTEEQRIKNSIEEALTTSNVEHKKEEMKLVDEISVLKEELKNEKEQRMQIVNTFNNKNNSEKDKDLVHQLILQRNTAPEKEKEPEKEKGNSKLHIALYSLVLVVALLIGFNVNQYLSTNNSTSNTSTDPIVEIKSSTNSDLKKGDTFPYTTKKGEKVTVTVENESSGKYIDSDGNVQEVIFK